MNYTERLARNRLAATHLASGWQQQPLPLIAAAAAAAAAAVPPSPLNRLRTCLVSHAGQHSVWLVPLAMLTLATDYMAKTADRLSQPPYKYKVDDVILYRNITLRHSWRGLTPSASLAHSRVFRFRMSVNGWFQFHWQTGSHFSNSLIGQAIWC